MNARATRVRGQAGFTLVELMMAVTIFAIATAGVYRAFSTGLSVRRREEEILETQRRAQRALERLADDLRNHIAYASQPFEGGEAHLAFHSLLPSPESSGRDPGICAIVYATARDTGVVRTARFLHPGAIQEDEILPSSWKIEFRYCRLQAERNEEEWTVAWDPAWGFPAAVRIHLQRTARPVATFTRTVDIPCGASWTNGDRRP